MATPLPHENDVDLAPPSADEVRTVIGGVLGAVAPDGVPTRLQRELFAALSHSMTGHDVDTAHIVPVGPIELAETLARRNAEFRTRISQLMLLGELVLPTVPDDVCSRVDRYIAELSIPNTFVAAGRDSSTSSLGFALADFGRNGYTNDWHPDQFPLRTSTALADAWEQTSKDDELADRWRGLAECPPGSLGRGVHAFYKNRGFQFPGTPDSAPPLLA